MRRGSNLKLSSVKEASSPPHDVDFSEDFSALNDSTDEQLIVGLPLSQRFLNYSLPSTRRNTLKLPKFLQSMESLYRSRSMIDSVSTPINCTDPIWLLGVGYDPSAGWRETPFPTLSRCSSIDSRRASSFRSSIYSTLTVTPGDGNALSSSSSKDLALYWPPEFYADFTSCVWITYRSHFQPIPDSSLGILEREQAEVVVAATPISSGSHSKRWWPGGEKGWTSDTGWGCMLRTGQSLLATALIHLHLGRDWRRPPHPVATADYSTYVQILTWFFDSPSPLCPFSVHRMALAGKELGKDVGQWFGPSTAAGAIKTLVHNFPEASLGISVAAKGQIFQSDVYSASHTPASSPRHRNFRQFSRWGERAVVVLIGIRLGIKGVNPIFYDTIKALFTFPQSIGIAGGRPSSSLYFVGSQADHLFYLDPHFPRTTIPLRSPPLATESEREHGAPVRQTTPKWGYTGSEPSDAASDTSLDRTQMHYVTGYSPAELRTFHCDRVRKIPLSGLDPSMLIGFLYKNEADWIDFRMRMTDLFSNHNTIFSIVDEPPSWSDVKEDRDEDEEDSDGDFFDAGEDARLYDRISSRAASKNRQSEGDTEEDPVGPMTPGFTSIVTNNTQVKGSTPKAHAVSFARTPSASIDGGDGDLDDEEDSDGDFFDAGEDAILYDRISSRAASKNRQSEGDTEEDPVGPMTPGSTSIVTNNTPVKGSTLKAHAVSFARTPSASIDGGDGDLDDEEWIDPTPIPATPLYATSPASIPRSAAPRVPALLPSVSVPFPSFRSQGAATVASAAGVDDNDGAPRILQMNMARGRDGGRTQSGGVKGVIGLDPGPERELELDTNPDYDDF